MPIFHNDKTPITINELHELNEKRARRDANRTKYKLIKKDTNPASYKKIKLVIDDVEYDISDSSRFLLDHLLAGKINKKQEI